MVHTKIIYNKDLDPWRNLALEEYLLSQIEENQCILYLWQNQNTVVIGKNQNAWRECRTKLLEEEGGKLARRLSGGGAVFHDTGNLNFTFLVDRKLYDVKKQLQVIIDAVQTVGISAQFSGRNDIVVDDKKFSGNAFYFRPQSAYHHGTILVDVDMQKLGRYLQVSKEKIESKGVKSVLSRVTNLKDYNSSLTIDMMKQSLKEAFGKIYGSPSEIDYKEIPLEKLDDLYQKYNKWEWRYGISPGFDIELNTRFPWGGVDIGLKLSKGVIDQAIVYSDAMDEAFITRLAKTLKDCRFDSSSMGQSILKMSSLSEEQQQMAQDVATWLEEKGF